MTDPTEKTMKPSHWIAQRRQVQAAQEGFELAPLNSAELAIIAYLDEQHAAGRGERCPGYQRNMYACHCGASSDRGSDGMTCLRCGGHMGRAEPAAPPDPAPGSREGANCGNCWACLERLEKNESELFDSRFCRMIVCITCGNKRCPKANDHRHECSGSNEPGQPGSAYEAAPIAEPPAPEAGHSALITPEQALSTLELFTGEPGDTRQSSITRSALGQATRPLRLLLQERDAALSQVEELKVELRKRDQREASLRDDLTEMQASCEARWSEFQSQCAVTVELRGALTELRGEFDSLSQCFIEDQNALVAATSRAEAVKEADGQYLFELAQALGLPESADPPGSALLLLAKATHDRAEAAEARAENWAKKLVVALRERAAANCERNEIRDAALKSKAELEMLANTLTQCNAELHVRAAKLEAELLTRIAREACRENGPGGDAGERAIVVGSTVMLAERGAPRLHEMLGNVDRFEPERLGVFVTWENGASCNYDAHELELADPPAPQEPGSEKP